MRHHISDMDEEQEDQRSSQCSRTTSAAARLRNCMQQVIDAWLDRLAERMPIVRGQPRSALVDSLPLFLSQMAEALEGNPLRSDATEGSSVPQEHGSQRVRLTDYRLDDLISEYQLLREVLLGSLTPGGALTSRESEVLNRSIDRAIVEAASAYMHTLATARERFMVQVAHDLRGPLSAIQSTARLLVRRPEAPEVARWASRIIGHVERADNMIRDLLDATRIEAGNRPKLDLEGCDMRNVARQAIENQSTIHGDRFVLKAPEPVEGHWSCAAMCRAIENLLTNAIKYGAQSMPVTVSVLRQGEVALIGVHNHGSYIAPSERETIFQAFHRADAARRGPQTGWGVGLGIVRGIAESHGGSVTIDSDPKRGTTFFMNLPLDARPFQGVE